MYVNNALLYFYLVEWRKLDKMNITSEIAGHKEAITCVKLSSDGRLVASVSKDTTLKVGVENIQILLSFSLF